MNLIKTEMKRTFKEALNYYPDYIVGLITDFLLLLVVINTEGNISEKVIGYIFWILVNGVMSEASLCISTEKQLGTLQNLMIRPYSIISIISVKTLVWFIINFVKSLIMIGIISVIFRINNIINPSFLYVVVLVCVGIMGISYILAALTLMFTKVASFVSVIGYLFLFLSGSIISIPEYLEYTNPLSYGVKYMLLQINQTSTIYDFLYLLIICLAWYFIGFLIFKTVFAHSKSFKWSY